MGKQTEMATVLVVDDDRVFQQLLVTILKLEGYETVAVTELEEIVATARREEPALIFMDVHIGNRDTLGALRELKHDDALSDIPIIMTSGMDRGQECMDGGADAFMFKPFRPSEMMEKIKELI